MNIITYQAIDLVPEEQAWVGFFEDNGEMLPMYFTAQYQAELRDKMRKWLENERAKVGLTAELVEKRKAALALARAARKAKKRGEG